MDCAREGRSDEPSLFIEPGVPGDARPRLERLFPADAFGATEPGGGGDGLNNEAMPEPTSPGCIPRNGVSKHISPRIRCLNGGDEL